MTKTTTNSYDYATDSEHGIIEATSFTDACRQLDAMLTPAMIEDGAHGWVEDCETGERYRIGGR